MGIVKRGNRRRSCPPTYPGSVNIDALVLHISQPRMQMSFHEVLRSKLAGKHLEGSSVNVTGIEQTPRPIRETPHVRVFL